MIEILQSTAHPTELEQAQRVWSACLGILSENVNSQSFKTWFEPMIPVSLKGSELVVQLPSQFFYDWIEEHFEGMINSTIARVLGREAKLQYEIVKEDPQIDAVPEALIPQMPKLEKRYFPPQPESFRVGNSMPISSHRNDNSNGSFQTFLNPRYMFENFIKGTLTRDRDARIGFAFTDRWYH